MRNDGNKNPRLQCKSCGRWMRLYGQDKDGVYYQRFFSEWEDLNDNHHEHDGNVCVLCESKLPNWKPYDNPMLMNTSND